MFTYRIYSSNRGRCMNIDSKHMSNISKIGNSIISHNRKCNSFRYSKKQSLQLWSDNYMRLNEALHLHEPDMISDYRKALKYIISDIAEKLINDMSIPYNHVLKAEFYPKFTEFIYNEPFSNDSILSCLNTLKIYIGFDNNTDAFIINDNDEDDKVIEDYLPLVKYTNTRPTLISIFVILDKIYKNNKDTIINQLSESLPHELKHIMDNCYNHIAVKKQSDINELIMNLQEEIKFPVKINGVFRKSWISNKDEFLWFMSECLYKTEKTELSAYLETTYSEYIESYKINKYNYDLFDSEVYEFYQYLDKVLLNVIKKESYFYRSYRKHINYILKEYNAIYSVKYKTFGELLNFMHKSFMQYFKQAAVIFNKVKEQNGKTT